MAGPRYAPLRLASGRKAEAQELALDRPGDRALLSVDLQLEAPLQEACHACHHPLARPATAHIDVAIVGVADEAMTAPRQLPVEHVQHQVRQGGWERPPLRHALVRRPDHPPLQPPRGETAASELELTL